MTHDPSVKTILYRLWRAKIAMAIGAILGLCAAFVYLALAVPQYEARMTIAPANPMNGAEMSSLMANDDLFALRYMMQRVGVSGSSDFIRFETMMTGHAAADLLLQSERVVEGLKAARRYRWSDMDTPLTAATLSAYLSKAIRIDPVGATSLHTISFRHPDAEFAAYFLTVLHGVTDGLIRRAIKDGAEQRVIYLQKAVSETVNPDHRRVLTTLLMEQERLKMLVSMDDDYAATLIEPPASLAKPVFPHKPSVLIVFVLIGLIAGYAVYSLRHD